MKTRLCLFVILVALVLITTAGQSAARELVFNLGYGAVQVIDVGTDTLLPDIPMKGWGREASFSADKKFLYVTASRHLIHKIDLQQMRVVKTIDLHYGGWQRFIYGFELVEDGKTAYIHYFPRKTDRGEAVVGPPTIAQIDLDSGRILRSVEVPSGVCSLAYSWNNKIVYAVGQDIYQIDVSKPEMKIAGTYSMFDKGMNILPLFTYTAENNGVALLPYWIGEAAGLLSIDTNTGKIEETPLRNPMMVYGAMYSPDMKKAYANMDELYVIDLASRTVTNAEIIPQGSTFSVMTSEDGRKIYLQGGPTITVYDAASLKIIKVLQMSTDGMLLRRVTL